MTPYPTLRECMAPYWQKDRNGVYCTLVKLLQFDWLGVPSPLLAARAVRFIGGVPKVP
jgi:hypothetical protein